MCSNTFGQAVYVYYKNVQISKIFGQFLKSNCVGTKTNNLIVEVTNFKISCNGLSTNFPLGHAGLLPREKKIYLFSIFGHFLIYIYTQYNYIYIYHCVLTY